MEKCKIFYYWSLGKTLFILLLCLSSVAFAQKKSVSGTVTDSSNEPIIGASILGEF